MNNSPFNNRNSMAQTHKNSKFQSHSSYILQLTLLASILRPTEPFELYRHITKCARMVCDPALDYMLEISDNLKLFTYSVCTQRPTHIPPERHLSWRGTSSYLPRWSRFCSNTRKHTYSNPNNQKLHAHHMHLERYIAKSRPEFPISILTCVAYCGGDGNLYCKSVCVCAQ